MDTFDKLYTPDLTEKLKQDVAKIRRAFPDLYTLEVHLGSVSRVGRLRPSF